MTDKKPGWGTVTTDVQPNSLIISGYKLDEIIANSTLLETAHLLVTTELPTPEVLEAHRKAAIKAALQPAPPIERFPGEDISKTLAKALLMDKELAAMPQKSDEEQINKTIYALGRFSRYLAKILGNEAALDKATESDPFADIIYRAVSGDSAVDPKRAKMLETIVVACVDHGVTPPSAQAGMIAATVRSAYEMSLASGVGAITDVHGGAGAKAAEFFKNCAAKAKDAGLDVSAATKTVIEEYMAGKKRIQGLGHRVHSRDPRRDVLWELSKSSGLAGPCVEISELVTDIFTEVKGKSLPINVDGVIGAIIADMELNIDLAKALFVYGRVAGLSAHYFEEISTQKQMRRINFSSFVYEGKEPRPFPKR
jgi:citrate synthase